MSLKNYKSCLPFEESLKHGWQNSIIVMSTLTGGHGVNAQFVDTARGYLYYHDAQNDSNGIYSISDVITAYELQQ